MDSNRYQILLLVSSVLALVWPVAAAISAASIYTASNCPRASLLSHWHGVFPTTEIPAILLDRSSPLTAAQVATFSSYIDSHTLSFPAHLSAFCSAAKILCSGNLPHVEGSDLEGPGQQAYQQYERANLVRLYQEYEGPKSAHNPARLEPGQFFREANITTGHTIHIPDIRDMMPRTYFLPKHLSDNLPFSSKSLASLVELLGVSNLQAAMSTTISYCEAPLILGEQKSCVRSIEDMANFIDRILGQKSEALVTQSTEGCGQDATVESAVARNSGKETATVACHRMMFPYMVYYCHMVPGVKVYNVELLIGDTAARKTNRLVAICHMDTSGWNSNHPAFATLGTEPGKTEACHFMFESAITWVRHDGPMHTST